MKLLIPSVSEKRKYEILILACVILSVSSFGQSDDGYGLSWYTIDGGGGTSIGGNFTLNGTIGQPDTGKMTGGDYVLAGGFWTGWIPCYVDLSDLANFLNEWLKKESEVGYPLDADLNEDGEVNMVDYNQFIGYWLKYCPDNWPSW